MTRIFVDTNILVYSHDKKYPAKRIRALELVNTANGTEQRLIISTQVLQEFYNTLTRKIALSPAKARDALESLTGIDVVTVTREIVIAATELHEQGSISFWDALIVCAAQSAGCQELWSEDMHTGQTFGSMTVVNPLLV